MAHKVHLTFASGAYDRMLPLFEGEGTIEAPIGFLHDQATIPARVGVHELFLPVYE